MQQLDADTVAPRERLERELAERLRGGRADGADGIDADRIRVNWPTQAPEAAAAICADCGAANDADARFCKACGTRLAAPDASAGVRALGVTLLLLGALTATALLAPGVSQPAFAQMPDLSQMSGQPLPSGDVPVGSVSVRVIRQTMSNNVTGVEVQLEAPPQTLKATTDANGRAVFSGVAQGRTWKAVAIVDGERLESQPFTIPSAGGLRMLLVAGLKTAASGGVAAPGTGTPGAAPGASVRAVPGDVSLGGQSRVRRRARRTEPGNLRPVRAEQPQRRAGDARQADRVRDARRCADGQRARRLDADGEGGWESRHGERAVPSRRDQRPDRVSLSVTAAAPCASRRRFRSRCRRPRSS